MSDNATNFTSADKELKADLKQVDFERVALGLRPLGVDFKWSFNPPAASHQGGVFERMIGLTRACLRRMMKDLSFISVTKITNKKITKINPENCLLFGILFKYFD